MTDNPNAFKHWFDDARVRRIADRFDAVLAFDSDAFFGQATDGLEQLELKDRVRQISAALRDHLDPNYPTAVGHIIESLPAGLETTAEVTNGFDIWPLCHFVEEYGIEHFDVSLNAMYELTQRFSAEFAIRPYLLRYPEDVLARLHAWTTDPNPHVRRWVSEGTRPRLPWGMRLQPFVDDPSPILPLLEALRHDPEEYVRRSVANNLNDIAKDHPRLVVEIAQRWWPDSNADERRMIKHALRTLVKNGDPGALAVLGFRPPDVEVVAFAVTPTSIGVGETLQISVELRASSPGQQRVLIDYAVHHQRANGTRSPKVFKWTTRELGEAPVSLTRNHSFRPISTRRYYPGEHLVELLINGESFGTRAFDLDF